MTELQTRLECWQAMKSVVECEIDNYGAKAFKTYRGVTAKQMKKFIAEMDKLI